MDDKSRKIWDMKLHESLELDSCTVLRVPGGWIYSLEEYGKPQCVFVPYIDEPSCNFQL